MRKILFLLLPLILFSDEIDKYRLLSKVRDAIEEEGWFYKKEENKTILHMRIKSREGTWKTVAWTREDENQFVFYSEVVDTFPNEKKCEILEYLAMVNNRLILGNFDVDFKSNKIRYKTSVDVTGGFLTKKMIKLLMEINLAMVDKYVPGLRMVINEEVTPEEAVLKMEGFIMKFKK